MSVEIPKTRICVVYAIWNNTNDNYYIGSTKDFRHRILTHLRKLKENKHHCRHLQYAFNKYGENSFEVIKLKDSFPTSMISDEQWCIDTLRPTYNSCRIAGNTLGLKWDSERRVKQMKYLSNISKSHRENISKSHKNNKDFIEEVTKRCSIMCLSNRRRIKVTNLYTQEIEIYDSIKDASKYLNANVNNIKSRLYKLVKSPYRDKYWFEYA